MTIRVALGVALSLTLQPCVALAADMWLLGGPRQFEPALAITREIQKAIELEKRIGAAPPSAIRKDVPLPTSNGPARAQAPATVSPRSLQTSIANQTPEQRAKLAKEFADQIGFLRKTLTELLAADPRTQEIEDQIKAFNEALNAKQQAYDFMRLSIKEMSPAAAESYAATANPYFLMCRSEFWAPNDPLRWGEQIARTASKLVASARSVGLLSVGDRPAGTGVVVGANHVLTNRHVVALLADYNPSTRIWTPRADAKITFDREYSLGPDSRCTKPNEPRSYSVNGVFLAPTGGDDLAIVLTSRDENFPVKVGFGQRSPRDYEGNMVVAVIGYPGPPDDMTIAEQLQFFRTPTTLTPQFGYKRLAGGYTGNRPVTSNGLFVHMANTSGGNSGSPVFDLADGALVGLHVQGHNRFQNQLGYNEALISDKINSVLRTGRLLAP